MSKPKVLLLGVIEEAHKEYNDLCRYAVIVEPQSQNRQDFLSESASGAFDGVLSIYRTFESLEITGLFDEELVAALPRSVKFISHNGAGYDQVDVHACTKKGIQVSHVPTAMEDSTADTAMFLILGALRNFNAPMNALRSGHWRGNPLPSLGHDPQGKVLGILGMGGIGRNLMKKAAAFGMTTQYHNRNKLSEELSGGATYVSFDELLATSDVLSLNVPLNKNTHHMISHAQFAAMKPGAVLVNTARGAVVDEEALVAALEMGQISSCGLDVFEEEPKVHEGLVKNPKVILLPHLGTWTLETLHKMEAWNLKNVKAAVTEGKLISPVVEQKGLKI